MTEEVPDNNETEEVAISILKIRNAMRQDQGPYKCSLSSELEPEFVMHLRVERGG